MNQKILRVFLTGFVVGAFRCSLQAKDVRVQAPAGLMCELLAEPSSVKIIDPRPEFSWIVNSTIPNDAQTAYRILVASNMEKLNEDIGDAWDSGKVKSAKSVAVTYGGRALVPERAYAWKVRTWNARGEAGDWSEPQQFETGNVHRGYETTRYRLQKSKVRPARMVKQADDDYFIDFGRAAFGTVKLTLANPGQARTIVVHLGEVTAGNDAIDRNPGGSRRYRKMTLRVEAGTKSYTLMIPHDKRNTGPKAIKLPKEIGEVMPFRYCEIEDWPYELDPDNITQLAVHYPFDDEAADFRCSNTVLNDVWDLCKYTIKATSFCGVYVDGDRERIPYEGDAYINQLCHYCVDREYTMARYSHEYLITHPTWPTEWIMHSVLMAWADYLYTGDTDSIRHFYDDLKAKTLIALAREDGLISVNTNRVTDQVLESIHFQGKLRNLVDWPHGGILGLKEGGYGETDGFVFKPINTVVNAYHYRALVLMSKMADAVGRKRDAAYFSEAAARVKTSFNRVFLNQQTGIYVDGEGTEHSSLHANMFPLAFGLVPESYRQSVGKFVKSRGMACSVYGAQHLLEGLYRNGMADYALELLTATHDRGWAHMIYDVGTTITLEAWDNKYKPNQDWNHAWGAAPANIIPRYVMGVRPLDPGFKRVLIMPQPGNLETTKLKLPTIRGTIHVDFVHKPGNSLIVNVELPANVMADVVLPKYDEAQDKLLVDKKLLTAEEARGRLRVTNIGGGRHQFVSREGL
jgi:hypothetical protein